MINQEVNKIVSIFNVFWHCLSQCKKKKNEKKKKKSEKKKKNEKKKV